MSYISQINTNQAILEYGKFVEITNDARFPAVSVVNYQYPDMGQPPVSSVSVYPKYGLITYLANASDINLVLSASEVDIGNVGLLDNSTNIAQTVYGQIINDQPNGTGGALMGSVRVRTELSSLTGKDFATDTTLRALTAVTYNTRITNTAPVSGSVTVLEQVPEIYTFHNFGIFTHRGWTMSDDLIPMITIRAKSTASKTVKILEYELGNNNTNSSTVGYVWYEDATITGTVPAFSSVNTDAEYRFYTDAFGSNTPNGFTGGTKRHSGIVIGKNSESESTLSNIPLTANGKNLTLCVQRLDSATKLDLWASMNLGIF